MNEFTISYQRYEVIADEPSSAFTKALAAIGVKVEGWIRHHGRFKSNRYPYKLAKGCWVRPGDMRGDLLLSYPGDLWSVHKEMLRLAEANGIYMNNGAMTSR